MQPVEPVKTFEQQVLERLDRIDVEIVGLKIDLNEISRDVREVKTDAAQNQKWQDRTWDVIKWVGGIASALAISAAIALVGLLIRLAL